MNNISVRSLRLFTALEIPELSASALSHLQKGIENVRWVAPKSFHITLRYIGMVKEKAASKINTALSEITAQNFLINIRGVGCFGKSKPRTLWAGVERAAQLETLCQIIDQKLINIGFPCEDKQYNPHITLARLKGAIQKHVIETWQTAHQQFRLSPFHAIHFTLFSSQPHKGHMIYTPEKTYRLQDSPERASSKNGFSH